MPPLSDQDRRALVALAREAIEQAVLHSRIVSPLNFAGVPAEPAAAFVTLLVGGHLRGCVGRTERDLPLAETVAQCAIGAALHDARFQSVGSDEIAELEIEISVLSELSRVAAAAEIEIGRHGLLVVSGKRRGLLLPQVAAERQWRAERFLAETCRKAGLGPESWRNVETQIFAFTVERFSESDFRWRYSSST
jgi:AmmeMemoRadiSam system protein A